jgi:hypothetical protein
MPEDPRADRVILTVNAIGDRVLSDPERLEPFLQQMRLEEALEPFRKKRGKKRRRPALGSTRSLEEQGEETSPD